jgi:ubiquinone/menaquinone biosynthesis C-methylase UbiE
MMARITYHVRAGTRAESSATAVPLIPRCPLHPDDGLLVACGARCACPTCGRVFANADAIFDLLPPGSDYPADFRERETAQWDSQADRYDERRRDAVYMAGVAAAADAVEPGDGELVLDAGCGTGLVSRRMWRPGVRLVALDLSAASLRRCRSVLPDALCVRGDLTRLPFASDSFDRVVCANAVQQLPEAQLRARCLRELARVTRPGGRVVVTVQNFSRSKRHAGWLKESRQATGPSGSVQYVYRYEPAELHDQLAEAGLCVESLCGAGLPLPYRLKLSRVSRALERLFRRVPACAPYAHMLVAVCRA